MTQIVLSGVSKRYPGGHDALANISLTVETGELVFITGHSGAGKSTLLKLMVAIERPTTGSVIVNGQNIGTLRARGIPFLRRNFGLVFQDHKLLFDRNAFENVMLPLDITGFDRREAARRARAALDKVGLLQVGLDADVLLLDGAPLDPATSVLRTWVSGREVR
jgi:cell division transport system ATP-binding protein